MVKADAGPGNNSRDAGVDIAKGLGILFIIGGHCDFGIANFPQAAFQIPLFYFISGFFISSYIKKNVFWLDFIRKKARVLLLPFFIYNAAFGIITWLLQFAGINIQPAGFFDLINFRNLFVEPFLSGHQYMISCPLWFVPSLFLVMLLVCGSAKLMEWSLKYRSFALVYAAILAMAYYSCCNVTFQQSPYIATICRTIIGYVFCIYGMLYYETKWPCKNCMVLVGALAIYACVSINYGNFSYSFVWNNYGEGSARILSLPVSLACVLIVVSLADVLAGKGIFRDKGGFVFWGRNTYHIMAVHLSFLLLLNVIIAILMPGKHLKDITGIYFRYPNIIFIYFFFMAGGSYLYLLALKKNLPRNLLGKILSRWSRDPA